MATGHGALIAIEVDPTGAPDVYQTVGDLTSDITQKWTLGGTENTPHNLSASTYEPDAVMELDELSIEVNYRYGNVGAYHMTLRNHFLNKRTFKLRLRGPGGTTNSDEVIYSGYLSSWQESNPRKTGSRKATGMFRPSGPFIVDGVTYGA